MIVMTLIIIDYKIFYHIAAYNICNLWKVPSIDMGKNCGPYVLFMISCL